MASKQQAREYVASLRVTGQYRKSYWYGVCFRANGSIEGHIPAVKRSWVDGTSPEAGRTIVVIKGSEC